MALKTFAEMNTLLADNTTGDISAQDMRDVIKGLWRRQIAPYTVDNAADVYWENNLGDFTTVTVTGSQTITEREGVLSVMFQDQATQDLNCVLKAHTFAVGDSFAVRIKMFELTVEDFCMAALVFADGTTSAANAIAAFAYFQSTGSGGILQPREGTLTAMATADVTTAWNPQLPIADGIYIRLTYQAANTWRTTWSIDGVNFLTLNQADSTFTLTPTHFGVGWSSWAGATDNIRQVSFGPICKLA